MKHISSIAQKILQKNPSYDNKTLLLITLNWQQIVGEKYYKISIPVKISWKKFSHNKYSKKSTNSKNKNSNIEVGYNYGSLLVKTHGKHISMMMHYSQIDIIQKINALLGYRCITEIKFCN